MKELDDEFSNDKVHKWLEETYGSEGIGHAYGHTWKDPRIISNEARLQNSRSAQSGHNEVFHVVFHGVPSRFLGLYIIFE